MAKRTNKGGDTDKDKLFASQAHRGIKPTDSADLTLDQLLAEGEKLLSEEAVKPKAADPLPKSKDYYRQARMQILAKMDAKKAAMLQRMEKEKDTNNGIYQNFVDEIIKVGDAISNN